MHDRTVRIGVVCRAELDGRRLIGRAAVFGPHADLGTHVERLDPHVFDEALADDTADVKALFNHDPNMLLGSTAAGTLHLRTDAEALHFAIDLPDTTYAHDVAALVRRGDLTGASFAMIPGGERFDRTAEGRHRVTHVRARRLLDVSPVTHPAYHDAGHLALRHLEQGRTVVRATHAGIARSQAIRIRAAARAIQRGTRP